MSMFSDALVQKALELLAQCRARGLTITTAESCTGGLLSALLTEIPGSSDVFTHGYITYANIAKTEMIGVNPALIAKHGAVSAEVAKAMAEGARKTSGAALAVAITGIAGPGGGSEHKPVGLVHFACARDGLVTLQNIQHFRGDRSAVRLQAVEASLELILRQMNHQRPPIS